MEAKSSVNFTVLSCSVQEEDLDKKESCTWQWDDLTVETRPQERKTLSEFDSLNRKGYGQKQETVFLVQRSPLQTIRAGVLGRDMQDYKLPYRPLLPVPLFVPNRLRTPEELSPEDLPFKQKMTPTNGLYPDKQDITALINSLPKVIHPSTLRVSSLISPPPSLYNANTH
ncbi:telethonin-like [Hyla sarda]|uniref:telethonin-like n=1 Tax=Hyla sarda TaxID=327740 RepID=UPI0024C462CC|nr:telethonin-like [Hyla sarda]